MSNPFQQRMPVMTDLRIRTRLLRAWAADHLLVSIGAFLVPAVAAWLFVVAPQQPGSINTEVLVAEIKAAQAAELLAAEGGIYHVTREITEGSDKQAFVAEVIGVTETVEPRTDVVETYQHSDTALALIESNGTERPFEAYLSREHTDGELALHHYGPTRRLVDQDREPYDAAHDLASLYTAYTSLERPSIPVLAPEAEFVALDPDTGQAQFRTVLSEDITVDSFVDLETKLVTEDIIYVKGAGSTYEMTRVTYRERAIIPAEQFEDVFDPTEFDYEVVAIRETA